MKTLFPALRPAIALILAALPLAVRAQQISAPSPQPPVAVAVAETVIGRAVVNPRENLEVTYTIYATQPVDSKMTGQKIRLEIAEKGTRDVTLDNGKTTQQSGRFSHSVSIGAGKYKTIGQLCGIVNGFFRRFLAGGNAANQDLGKIGDAKYGGELHFVAESAERLRFDDVPTETRPEDASRFSRADVEAFAKLLAR